MKLKTLLRLTIVLLMFFILLLGFYIGNIYIEVALTKILHKEKRAEIVVNRGVKVRDFAKILEKNGYVSSATFFTVAYVSQYPSKSMQAGLYEISDQDTIVDLVEKIAKGKSKLESITFIEGSNWQQIKRQIRSNKQFINHKDSDLLKMFKSKGLLKIYGEKILSLEGLLMPDTYKFKRGINDHTILEESIIKQVKYIEGEWSNRDLSTQYNNPYEALIVASLIEKESRYTPEYSKIAAVILNRIQKKIPIQIDAAVIYGLEKHKKRLYYSDLKKKGPYNTYLNKGLPPTPIAMPSKEAIHAALHPYKFDAIFYVLDSVKNNQHTFSNNFREHLQAKNKRSTTNKN
ncbi:MAG: endolytic transglycosylase MltG [Pseudomonadota bacterium]|nr:endolytic transglycosylase MltG [Pseudomonadota bacterium]